MKKNHCDGSLRDREEFSMGRQMSGSIIGQLSHILQRVKDNPPRAPY
jgi:hypothetical protein